MSKPRGRHAGPRACRRGSRHHIVRRARRPRRPRRCPRASKAVFESSQRRRVTACVQAKRWVSCSSSRASSGAPTKRPTSAGSTASPRAAAAQPPNSLSKCRTIRSQPAARRRRQAARDRVAVVFAAWIGRCVASAVAASPTSSAEPGDELGPVLPPRHPCHRSGSLSGGVGSVGAGRRPGAMYASSSSSSPTRSTRPGRVDDRPVVPDEQGRLAAAVPLADDLGDVADLPERPLGARQEAVRLEQLLDVALEPHAPVAEQDDVVADPLDVGDHVRRDHDRRVRSRRRRPSAAAGTRGRRADRAARTARRAAAATAACRARAPARAGRGHPRPARATLPRDDRRARNSRGDARRPSAGSSCARTRAFSATVNER